MGSEQPRAGVISRRTVIECTSLVGAAPSSWVVVSEQVCVEYQNHPLALPIRLLLISCQCVPERWYPAAVTVPIGGWPDPRVIVSTTLNPDNVATAICRCGGWLAPVALTAAAVVTRPTAASRAPTTAARRRAREIMANPLHARAPVGPVSVCDRLGSTGRAPASCRRSKVMYCIASPCVITGGPCRRDLRVRHRATAAKGEPSPSGEGSPCPAFAQPRWVEAKMRRGSHAIPTGEHDVHFGQ